MTKLKPCPFCGGEAVVTCLNKGQYQARVGCGGCGATINRFFRSKADAAEAWNTRWERTCEDISAEYGKFVCGACGCVVHDTSVIDNGGLYHCPDCGDEVIDE